MAQRFLELEHSLGKGEVVSSILTGSTRKAYEIRTSGTPSPARLGSFLRNEARIAQTWQRTFSGLCSASVRPRWYPIECPGVVR